MTPPTARLPPLGALRAFETAARHLSFTAAAAELHVTQAAISHQIRQLEEDLGLRLFVRLNRALRLTEEGRTLLPFVRDGFSQIRAGVERLRAAGRGGVLTLTAPPSFAASWLVPRLVRFQASHPGLEVRLQTSMRLVDLAREGIDAGIRYGRGAWPGLAAERLFSDELFPVCAPGLVETARRDLATLQLLHIESFPDDWRRWLAAAGIGGVDAEKGSWFDAAALAYEAAASGLGVAIGRSHLVAAAIEAGKLVAPFGVELPAEVAYYLVHPPESASLAKVATFRAWLRAEVARGAGGAASGSA
jgi:LysR family glycine cleavage system transcriptional activator